MEKYSLQTDLILCDYWHTGTASVARGMSSYIDALTNYTMRDAFLSISPKWEVDFLSKYPDFFSFVVVMLLAGW